jgi:pyruvate-formate lyase-activating enzyme
MASSTPLHGSELIDCARANTNQGIEVASQRCGYGEDLPTFERELKKACASIGIDIKSFKDLTEDGAQRKKEQGIEIAPETPNQL